jgi:Dipeptidyl aminopeptidases/acylaminoacyl-peptidases
MRGFDYEEYKMKSKFLKCIIVAGSLAFMNCGDDASTAPNLNPNSGIPGIASSSDAANPADLGLSSSSVSGEIGGGAGPVSSADVPASSADAVPTSSADAPASSADVTPTSSAVTPASSAVTPASSAETPASSAVAPASSSSEATSSATVSSSSEAPKGIFLAEGNEEEKDQLKVVYKTRTGWDGGGILCYPEKLSDTQKHGIVVWGPGGGSKPEEYEGMIRRLASHGFVVIGLKESPGDASQAIKALDWMEQQNKDSGSPLYGKLDMNVVGCSGHSMGGLESEQAAIKDKRVITAFLNNSGDRNGGAFKNIPATKTAGVVFGEKGMEHDNAIADYNSAKSVPACMIEMTGGPMNSEGGYGHGSGPWDGMAATIAWMRWHLGGETERKADFVGTSGKYIDGNIIGKQGKWKGQCKNFK